MKRKILKQIEIFDEIASKGLSPNQYYLLCCMHDSVTPLKINLHLELRLLIQDGWITTENQLTPKAMIFIQKIEKFFVIQKTKTSNQIMGEGHTENITKYREMFPNIKLPSGKAARSAVGNLDKAFRWFFQNHDYEWKIIFDATATYLNDQEKKSWKFCRTSQYFIRKQELSDLADICEMIKTGGDTPQEHKHSIKVV